MIIFDSKKYKEYIDIQVHQAASFESENFVWSNGQVRFIEFVNNWLSEGMKLLDCACGEGIGVEELIKKNFDACGVDVNEEKIARALKKNLPVQIGDMHDLLMFDENKFDGIVCSHTLEHAFSPSHVLLEFKRTLISNGLLFIVLPFPDTGDGNADVHIAKSEIGTDDPVDGEAKIIRFFEDNGYKVLDSRRDSYREPEIWLVLQSLK